VDGGGVVQDGQLWVGLIPGFEIPANATPERATSKLTITPLQPVTAIAFTTITSPWWVIYTYDGVDQSGEPFTGGGTAPYPGTSTGAQTTVLAAPGGGHFTRVVLWNWEYSWWLNGLAAPGGFFGVTSVTLRVDQATGQCPIAQSHWKNQPDV
jgi:hypothetical protein